MDYRPWKEREPVIVFVCISVVELIVRYKAVSSAKSHLCLRKREFGRELRSEF